MAQTKVLDNVADTTSATVVPYGQMFASCSGGSFSVTVNGAVTNIASGEGKIITISPGDNAAVTATAGSTTAWVGHVYDSRDIIVA